MLQAQLDRVEAGRLAPPEMKLARKAHAILDAARNAAEDRRPTLSGASSKDRVLSNIHEAELILLQLAPDSEIRWRGPVVLAQGVQHLGENDPRLKVLSEHLRNNNNILGNEFRELAVNVLHAANHVEESEIARVRSFRNVVVYSFLAMSAIAALLILSGYLHPDGVPNLLCFDPPAPTPSNPLATKRVCPAGGSADGDDGLLVGSLGMCAAAMAGAVSIRHMQGTLTPYMVPLSLLALRLPVGVLSALLGLILIHGKFIPGLSALDTQAQIAAWAIAFGVAQETLTRMIDRQGNAVMENVRGSWRSFDSPPPRPEDVPRAEAPVPSLPSADRRPWPFRNRP
ncbi:hypothetical protein JL475_34350 [Streptomyces sp. M2CJ-2]|uniref:hypothetical protein n=1 Tax=Streptomyces sp. M2CJ-2 TaxID=2803948 RepID=UPI001927E299|nr:hypothetical protein [Streptomyces sp. M2CJ-2]MBL3670942.1 hypothetical protein [Streptomyces sp. M2CJ-2]